MPHRPRTGDATPLDALLARLEGRPQLIIGAPRPDLLATGFPSLDARLGGGLRRDDLCVLGGSVGSGKSALVLGLGLRVAREGHAVVIVSGEHGPERLLERMLALMTGLSLEKLRGGRLDEIELATIRAAAVELDGLPLTFEAPSSLTPGDPFGGLVAAHDARLLVVDALELFATSGATGLGASRQERTAELVLAAKSTARAAGIAVLGVVHFPDFDARRADPRPTLDDFGGRGAVRETADVVLALHREEMYRSEPGIAGAAELLVLKHRDGQPGLVDLYFHARQLRFEDLADPTP
jgi:replicative DNA helicase